MGSEQDENRKAKPMTERGPEWQALRRIVECVDGGFSYCGDIADRFGQSSIAALQIRNAFIDAATDYLWNLGVRG